ncbi:sugar phosphate isomerase/epimerase family protein [Sporomusa acidovorans]|uniref:5-keto-L-gluconate epimerase n=1 Tax=Sporomusa acidovorans (strain ATCC 49682 / DSM 3132 / Mol) TaxID=1123286 RepID=A0ABZ3J296_SPOA4|nr:sugar phosphate isomerase/epimerase family protein [Sporomusa acidovorans]OZC24139.1 D-tagatose 3-epimerase [Sporomusa acidovorans DSM 3132]SDF36837.1 Sugar phosphate isomerase/epimerase [Sporomusa acidovorans]
MKLAYPVGTPEARGKMLAYQGEFADICSTLKSIGYSGVELFVRSPQEMDVSRVSRAIEKQNLEVAAIGTGPLVGEDKLTFTALDESRRRAAIDRTKVVIDFAALFGTQVIIGKLRGDLQAGNVEISKKWMKEAFLEVGAYAHTRNVKITIEPQSRLAVNNLNTAEQAVEWINELKLPNLYVMLDSYHMNIEETSMAAGILAAKGHNIHMHLADDNRGIPGTGQIDFHDLVRRLRAIQYRYYLSLEINQFPDSFKAAQASFEYLYPIITEKR